MLTNILASRAREAGHDGVITYGRTPGGRVELKEAFDVRERTNPLRTGESTLHPQYQADLAPMVRPSEEDARFVRDEETGLLVEPGDPVALRAAIDRLLADDELRHRLGRAGRERIIGLCGWERVIDATFATYAEAAGREDLLAPRAPEPVPAAA